MTQDLITTFGKSDGGTHDWTYKGLDPNLAAQEIKAACELLTNLDICTKDGVKLFDSVITAKIVTTKETIMFSPEHETRGVKYYGETVEKPVEEQTCEEVGCFEVAVEPKKLRETASKNQRTEKVNLMTRPFRPLADFTEKQKVHSFKQAKNTGASGKAEKDTFPKIKLEHQTTEKQNQIPALPTSSTQMQEQKQLASTPRNTKAGWFQRIFRNRSRNKEDPEKIPRE